MPNAKLDELHRSMGEFLTECAHLENMLHALFTICELDKKASVDVQAFQDIKMEFLPLTFGQRVNLLIETWSTHQFSDAHRAILETEFKRLKGLVQKRNLIVHGTTYEIGFDASGETNPIRIGAPKGNLEHMQQFFDQKGDIAHSFTADQAREASTLCVNIRGEIAKVVVDLMTPKTQSTLESDRV